MFQPSGLLGFTEIYIPGLLLQTKYGNQSAVKTNDWYSEPTSAILTARLKRTHVFQMIFHHFEIFYIFHGVILSANAYRIVSRRFISI